MVRIDLELQKHENDKYLFLVNFWTQDKGFVGKCCLSVEDSSTTLSPVEGEETIPNPIDQNNRTAEEFIKERELIFQRVHELGRIYVKAMQQRSVYHWMK